MTYEQLRQKINDGFYQVAYADYPVPDFWSWDHVSDPDKSINWNKEQIQIHNNRRQEAMQARRAAEAKMYEAFRKDCIDYILFEFSGHDSEIVVPQAAAMLVYNKAWEDGHANGYHEVLSHISDLLSFLVQFADFVRSAK